MPYGHVVQFALSQYFMVQWLLAVDDDEASGRCAYRYCSELGGNISLCLCVCVCGRCDAWPDMACKSGFIE